VISGTPTVASPTAIYLVTAGNAYGVATATLSIAVDASPPTNPTGSMAVGREAHAATLLQDGTVLITGGRTSAGAVASAELYRPASGKFSSTVAGNALTMTTARFGHTATRLQDGKVLIAGGWTESGSVLDDAELYDPAAGTFTATGPMTAGRHHHSATLLASGKVLIAGGTTNQVAELYDPSTGKFTSTGSMTIARSGHAVVLLPSGKVLLAGGASDASAEVYDPASGRFTATANMTATNASAAAVLLPSGKVFLAGTGDRELFDPAAPGFIQVGDGFPNPSVALWNGAAPIVAWGDQSTADDPAWCGTLESTIAGYALIDPATGAAAFSRSLDGYFSTLTTLATGEVLIAGGYRAYTDTERCIFVTDYLDSALLASR
jgi:hypothetical protein